MPPDATTDLADRIAQLVQDKRGAEAVALLQAEGSDAAGAVPWLVLAGQLWAQNDFPAAEAAFREVIARHPRDDSALIHLSLLSEWRGDRAQAKAILAGDGSAPLSGIIAARLGLLRVAEHDFFNAEPVLRFAISQPGTPPHSWRDLSDTLGHLGRHQEAMAVAREAVDRFPEDPGAQAWLGHLLIDAGRPAEAIGFLAVAIASHHAPPYARTRYAEALFRTEQKPACLEQVRLALAEQPDRAPASSAHLGYLLVRCGELDEGTALLDLAVAADPADPNMRLLQSSAYFDEGRVAEAAVVAREAAEAMPDNADIQNRYGHMLLAASQHALATQAFARAIELNPTMLHAWIGQCEAARLCKQFKVAIAAFRKLPELGADAETIRIQRYRLFGEVS